MIHRNALCFIVDVVQVIERLLGDVNGVSYQAFLGNSRLQRATLFDLSMLRKAIGEVSVQSNIQHDELPWAEMQGLSNKMPLGYMDINLETVWEVLTVDLPNLLSQLKASEDNLGRSIGR